ncbi:PREDICTED: uncharacterized protein LOC104588009 [Nelumbo nucifera]|uniref:Uncharacterized protein n=2 Tax=Nelumbo nucifera TaxID=4432 RepID=A0A822ZYN1_NELNU|nr:PREDICTED: uncharacterized protein LOC104588009 [Nelumbo nucifera]DAD47048.1 TPA_asm: hypothetical protein HUJ06_016985 [Nelumbo nucifera]
MEASALPSLCPKPSTLFLINKPFTTQIFLHTAPRRVQPLRAGPDGSSGSTGANGDGGDTPPPVTPAVAPPEKVEIRFRRGSRRRSRQQDGNSAGGLPKAPAPPKDWELMTITEKAVELYMGEKGLLFWLNKFAYASIFIIIGGWILFRFVGPSLGLYQLDSSPLPPSAMFKGS